MTQLRLVDMERLIRDLISDSGLTATLLTVQADPRGWLIVIRSDHNRVFDIRLPDTLTVAELRMCIEQYLLTHV